jgi:transcriptional regulator with XRE-family HTH domain
MMKSEPFLTSLKTALRIQGMTYAQIAKKIGVSQSTVKRWFSSGGMSLDHYAQLLSISGVSLQDLTKMLGVQSEAEVYTYTLDQETYLSKHPSSHAFFNLLLRHGSVSELKKKIKMPELLIMQSLRQLDKIGLIECQEKTRFRLLVAKKVAWRKDGPLRRQFLAEAKKEFLQSDFGGRHSSFRFLNIPLSERSLNEFIGQCSRATSEIVQISEVEKSVHPDLVEYGILMAIRPWTFSKFEIKP